MTLWVMARSPLMIGGDLPLSDPATIALFTNADVLEVHRCSTGNHEVFREGPLVLWAARGPGGTRYAAAFNLGETPLAVTLDAANAGLPSVLDGEVRELWTRALLRPRSVTAQSDAARGVAPGSCALDVGIPPHGAVLLRYRPRT